MNPLIQAFNLHVSTPVFQLGVDKGRWTVLGDVPERPSWPLIQVYIRASKKYNAPDGFYFQFNLEGYPKNPPTACVWDIETNKKLSVEKFPKGGPLITAVFLPGSDNLYAPCDRNANLPGHKANWEQVHKDFFWNDNSTILTYIKFISHLLNSGDYADN